MMSLLRHILPFIVHLQVTVNVKRFFFLVACSISCCIVVFIKLRFMPLVFVLVGVHSIFALNYCYFQLFIRILYLKPCVMLLCGGVWGLFWVYGDDVGVVWVFVSFADVPTPRHQAAPYRSVSTLTQQLN